MRRCTARSFFYAKVQQSRQSSVFGASKTLILYLGVSNSNRTRASSVIKGLRQATHNFSSINVKRERWMWQEDEEEDVRSYRMTLRTGEDTLIWKRRLWIALCGGIVLEEALDLSSDSILHNNNNNNVNYLFNMNTILRIFNLLILLLLLYSKMLLYSKYC